MLNNVGKRSDSRWETGRQPSGGKEVIQSLPLPRFATAPRIPARSLFKRPETCEAAKGGALSMQRTAVTTGGVFLAAQPKLLPTRCANSDANAGLARDLRTDSLVLRRVQTKLKRPAVHTKY